MTLLITDKLASSFSPQFSSICFCNAELDPDPESELPEDEDEPEFPFEPLSKFELIEPALPKLGFGLNTVILKQLKFIISKQIKNFSNFILTPFSYYQPEL